MLTKRYRDERGPTDAGWLKSMHSFSFGHYHNPEHMGFGPLRVINEDRVVPGAGFGTHPHANMEIISYVLSGELAHKDSLGNGSVIKPGDVQIMSAGTGVAHSEFNNSNESGVHFLQIWIMPSVQNAQPNYQQKSFADAELRNQFHTVISPDGAEGSLTIRQDARMLAGKFDEGAEVKLPIEPGRKYWLQVAQGIAEVNGEKVNAGDGLAMEGETLISVKSITQSEILVFDLP
jgi:quercetin 2,3-dioxygenase